MKRDPLGSYRIDITIVCNVFEINYYIFSYALTAWKIGLTEEGNMQVDTCK